MQNRAKSAVWWMGMLSCVYEAVIGAAATAGISVPWYIGAIGVALSAVLVYCNGNNPSLADRY